MKSQLLKLLTIITTGVRNTPALYNWFRNPVNTILLFTVIVLGGVVFFKNQRIEKLEGIIFELENMTPIIEYKFNTDTIIIKESVPEPFYVYINDTIIKKDTITIDNTKEEILDAYDALMQDFHTTKKYDNILVNDSSLFATLKEDVTANTLTHREFSYSLKAPRIIEKTYTIKESYHRVLGGVQAGTGGIFLGGAYQRPNGNIYTISYDPVNKFTMIGGYINIFKLRTK